MRASEIKLALKNLIPQGLYRNIRLLRRAPTLIKGALYDLNRYIKYSSAVNYDDDESKLRAIITATYHNIEKGLSLPEPRIGFGKENLSKLIGYIDEYIKRYGSKKHLNIPITVIEKYVLFNESNGHPVPVIKETCQRLQKINQIEDSLSGEFEGGVIEVSKNEIVESVAPINQSFFDNRFSCRQFSKEPITNEQIMFAVRAAQKAPVVCNRQSGKVYVFQNDKDIKRILELQGGARGFLSEVNTLFCLTTDLRNFHGVGERYQGWIDGGLFSMSFIFGLHAQGIGSCCLNWSKDGGQDQEMRRLIGINASETIMMFVAAGHLLDHFKVAKSNRKEIKEIVEFKFI